VQDLSEAVVELSCVTDNTCGSVHNTLQCLSDRRSGSSQYSIAVVDTGGHERVDINIVAANDNTA